MRNRSRSGVSNNTDTERQDENAESNVISDPNDFDGPPSKKRKLAETTPRPVSPPWRREAVAVPSFVEDGRRKSSRTNNLPIELQPLSSKRQTRSAIQRTSISKGRHGAPQQDAATSLATKRPLSAGKPYGSVAGKSPVKSCTQKNNSSIKAGTSLLRRKSISSPPRPSAAPGPKRKPQAIRHSARVSEAALARAPQMKGYTSEEAPSADSNYKAPKLRFKVKVPEVSIQHPGHIMSPPKYSSFEQWLEHEDHLAEEGNSRLTADDIQKEAQIYLRLEDAGQPGGILSEENCTIYMPDPQEEPLQQFTHQDHLVAQALHLGKLMASERKQHLINAKKLALAAAAEWKRRQPKTDEEIIQERIDASLARHKQLQKDLQSKWDLISEEVKRRKATEWQEEQQMIQRQALNHILQQSTQLLHARRVRSSEPFSDNNSPHHSENESEASGHSFRQADEDNMSSARSERDEDNMSSAGSESDEDNRVANAICDEKLSVDELRKKYANITSVSEPRELFSQEPPSTEALVDHPELRNLDDILLDNSDSSTDMEDDMGDSDDEETVEETDSDESDDVDPGILGFLGKHERELDHSQVHEEPPSDDMIKSEEGTEDADEIVLIPSGPRPPNGSTNVFRETYISESYNQVDTVIPDVPCDEIGPLIINHSGQPSPGTITTTKPSDVDSVSSIDHHQDSLHPSSTTTPQPTFHIKTPIPSLLRGTLREYQHYGLDWLAGLYLNHTNGILADEMGLGKTIQTIALLAHLATEHHVWGPHLVIVPTSVMLNWEMEFKKWAPGFKILTYYGSIEERKLKRKGWLDNNLWNVCITSYQLVLADQKSFKKRTWHYMVLDEAHNIKNFRSQRWQTLLTFKTRARLLLTGTPLQNNLTELWSLLFFLMPSNSAENGIGGFADLKEFSDWFRRPVEQILENGRETMDDEAKQIVTKLHKVLRPYLLRRLKADVEKQMPGKYEHVINCRLSKRQRLLYDEFMSKTTTKETLASGTYISIINCLMQLRKVCNHPDLFETREIVTSFAMDKSAIADYEITELLVRKRLLYNDPMDQVNLNLLNLTPTANEGIGLMAARESSRLITILPLQELCKRESQRIDWRMKLNSSSIQSTLNYLENSAKISRLEELRQCVYLNALRSQRRPIYGSGLINLLKIDVGIPSLLPPPRPKQLHSEHYLNKSSRICSMVPTLAERADSFTKTLEKFACITPSVVTTDLVPLTLTKSGMSTIQQAQVLCKSDAFHDARVRLTIAFPDKRLLQYDCGKLQRLDKLLRELEAGGHRALIFTQMTRVLDILEQFLNIHGHRYLRLDGSTKIEQRQILTDRFNKDTRILAFILSSRSGGIGINLTGADTVIFYDLDWNPAMDKQCQDRCHRIGQTRDVHIYRLVCEYTIESNILRKANQKRMLDDVVIQEGEFTTDYFNKISVRDVLGDEPATLNADESANAAMDRILGVSGEVAVESALARVEDIEDTEAANMAKKELMHTDDGDFEERTQSQPTALVTACTSATETPQEQLLDPVATPTASLGGGLTEETPIFNTEQISNSNDKLPIADDVLETDEPGHVEEYMLRFIQWELRDAPIVPIDKNKSKKKGALWNRGHK
ncbi:MAG: swr1 complex component [Trizodia sp. TS-e1964]|nr:MAG: swr1 complex component [Trizodia sp. TS-e1964]